MLHTQTDKNALQGSANPQTPGSENKRIKICDFPPAAGRRTQLFHLIFSEPGVCGFADPCRGRCLDEGRLVCINLEYSKLYLKIDTNSDTQTVNL